MRITMIDDSIPFDGATPGKRALGGPEKAFAALAAALARRGHEVTAINRCEVQAKVGGVTWLPFETPRPPRTDVLIAFRRPQLLGEVAEAGQRILWSTTHGRLLGRPRHQDLIDRYRPALVFLGKAHFETWDAWRQFREAIIRPGVDDAYLAEVELPEESGIEPRAVVTTHPLHGLSDLVDLWTKKVRPRAPEATLHVYSGSLYRAAQGGEVSDKLRGVYERVMNAIDEGVVVERPAQDAEMAEVYRRSAVHLYPLVENEVYCWTLAESQAVGLPGVAREFPAATERIRNGQTGFLVPDAAAMANVTVHLLTNVGARAGMRRDARTLQGGRTWDKAAADFETLWQ
jgi:glycosyltransferase involved in cell wall biosynthesis